MLRQARVYYRHQKSGVDGSRMLRTVHPITAEGIDWQSPQSCATPLEQLRTEPEAGAGFAELPGFAMEKANYKTVEEEWEEWIYRNDGIEIYYAPLIDTYSKMGESEGALRARIAHAAREARDAAIDAIREKMQSKLRTKEDQLRRALAAVERERSQAQAAKIDAGASVLSTIFGVLLGSKKLSSSTMRKGASSARSAGRALQQHRDIEVAEAKAEDIQAAIREMQDSMAEEIDALEEKFDPAAIELETISIKPYKKDISIEEVALLWIG